MSWYPPPSDPYGQNGYAAGGHYPPPAAQPQPPYPQHYPQAGAPSYRFDYGPEAAAAAAAAMAATLGGHASTISSQSPYGHAPPPPSPYPYPPQSQHPHQLTPQPSTSHLAPTAMTPHYSSRAPSIEHQGSFPPPPDVATDPNSFRRYFMKQLAGLSFNSKPLITNLTLFAHEHLIRMAPIVASCLEIHLKESFTIWTRIKRADINPAYSALLNRSSHYRSQLEKCPPTYKLPALYLLDSISKNIGPPYLALFAKFIERTFLTVYHSVDPPIRTKMEELLGTWRTGGQDGGELFRQPDEGRNGRVQRGIESNLFGNKGKGGGLGAGGRPLSESESYQSGVQQLPAAASTDERSGVLFDLRRLLQRRVDQAIQNPSDEVNKRQIDALKKLEDLVLNTQLTADQVNQIRGQLAALAPREPSVDPHTIRASSSQPPFHLAPPTPSLEQLNQLARSLSPPALDNAPPINHLHYQSISMPPMPLAGGSRDSTPSFGGLPPGLSAPAPPAASAPIPGIDLSLLASLQANGGLQSLLGSIKATPPPPDIKPIMNGEGPTDSLIEDYDRAVAAFNIPFGTSHFSKINIDAAASFLYDRMRLQCQQCGIRFFDSALGKKYMDAHLDWHFTYKRRVREGAGRTQGRSWLSLEEDWLHSDDLDLEAKKEQGNEGKNLNETKIDLEALRKKKVIAPSGGEERRCPICREKFKSEWSDQDEDWVYWNAVKVDGSIYHATCHAEAKAARSKANDALLTANQSREATPAEVSALLKKRKNEVVPKEEDEPGNGGQEELESPAKKVKSEE